MFFGGGSDEIRSKAKSGPGSEGVVGLNSEGSIFSCNEILKPNEMIGVKEEDNIESVGEKLFVKIIKKLNYEAFTDHQECAESEG